LFWLQHADFKVGTERLLAKMALKRELVFLVLRFVAALQEESSDVSCDAGFYDGQVQASLSHADDMLGCFARLLQMVPHGRFFNFGYEGKGCSLIRTGTELLIRSNSTNWKACEIYPLAFAEDTTMGRDLASCYGTSGTCEEGKVLRASCCAPPWFEQCAKSVTSRLAQCVRGRRRPPPHRSDYKNRIFGAVIGCFSEMFRISGVLELFTGSGEYLGGLQHLKSKVKIFSLEMEDDLVRHVQRRYNATVFTLSHDPGPLLKNKRAPAVPARGLLAELKEGLYVLHGASLPAPDETLGTAPFLVPDPDSILQAMCESWSGTPIVLLLETGGKYSPHREWSILAEACNIVAIFLFQTNHPHHTGFIRDHLLSTSNSWADVFRWQDVIMDEADAWLSALDRSFLGRRTRSLLINSQFCAALQEAGDG